MPVAKLVLILCALILLSACDNYPKDPKHTLKTVQKEGILKVGIIEQQPWTSIERNIAAAFAQNLGAQVEWGTYSESEAIERLKNHDLHMVIGGLTKASPWKKEVGFTRPYLKNGDKKKDKHVLAIPRGENLFIVTLEKFLKNYHLPETPEENT